MSFQVRSEKRTVAGNLDGTVWVLEDSAGTSRAEVWPALGFNCYRWLVQRAGHFSEVLYTDPDLFNNGRPTRSGIPILFPFPNRLRAGRFTWEGQEYRLPLNDSTNQNAIHGFVCRKPWRVVGQGGGEHDAWVKGEFQGSVDAPETATLWPSDYRIRVTIRLGADRLRVEAVVDNPGMTALPFGLGYHPYFVVPLAADGNEQTCIVEAPARKFWELTDSLPTGIRHPVDAGRDLTRPRPLSELHLDDVLTALDLPEVPGSDGLRLHGVIRDRAGQRELRVLASPAFRELVAFNPPHRRAICLEPYTCTTDAINLQPRGMDAGLLVLSPGQQWQGVVEVRA